MEYFDSRVPVYELAQGRLAYVKISKQKDMYRIYLPIEHRFLASTPWRDTFEEAQEDLVKKVSEQRRIFKGAKHCGYLQEDGRIKRK